MTPEISHLHAAYELESALRALEPDDYKNQVLVGRARVTYLRKALRSALVDLQAVRSHLKPSDAQDQVA